MNNESDKKVYTCPMHPEIMEDAPGRCPKCGMNLVAVDAGTVASAAGSEHNHKSSGGCCG